MGGTHAGEPTGPIGGGQTGRSAMRSAEPAGGARVCRGGGSPSKAQVREDLADDLGIFDGRDEAHGAASTSTSKARRIRSAHAQERSLLAGDHPNSWPCRMKPINNESIERLARARRPRPHSLEPSGDPLGVAR